MSPKETGCANSFGTTSIDKVDATLATRRSESQAFPGPRNACGSLKYLPGSFLSRHIAYYWLITGGMHKTSRISLYPNGGVGLIFNFSESLLLGGKTTVGKGLFFDGSSAKTVHLYPVGDINILGIRFRPGGFNRFFVADLGKFHNMFGKIDCIEHIFPERCLDIVALFATDREKIAAIETWLTCNYSETDDTISLVQLVVDAICSDQHYFDLQSFLYGTDMDIRRLQRLFKKEVGMSSKKMARIIRAGGARRLLLNNSNLSFSNIAYKCGYYDQAHFNRDFKYVFGNTPSAYRKNADCSEEGPTILD